jgi:hypothetical protein
MSTPVADCQSWSRSQIMQPNTLISCTPTLVLRASSSSSSTDEGSAAAAAGAGSKQPPQPPAAAQAPGGKKPGAKGSSSSSAAAAAAAEAAAAASSNALRLVVKPVGPGGWLAQHPPAADTALGGARAAALVLRSLCLCSSSSHSSPPALALPAGTYPTRVLLSSPTDVRVVDVVAEVALPAQSYALELECAARGRASQEVPLVNAGDRCAACG